MTGKPGWWEAMVGPDRPIDTERYFVICPNVVGDASHVELAFLFVAPCELALGGCVVHDRGGSSARYGNMEHAMYRRKIGTTLAALVLLAGTCTATLAAGGGGGGGGGGGAGGAGGRSRRRGRCRSGERWRRERRGGCRSWEWWDRRHGSRERCRHWSGNRGRSRSREYYNRHAWRHHQ